MCLFDYAVLGTEIRCKSYKSSQPEYFHPSSDSNQWRSTKYHANLRTRWIPKWTILYVPMGRQFPGLFQGHDGAYEGRNYWGTIESRRNRINRNTKKKIDQQPARKKLTKSMIIYRWIEPYLSIVHNRKWFVNLSVVSLVRSRRLQMLHGCRLKWYWTCRS